MLNNLCMNFIIGLSVLALSLFNFTAFAQTKNMAEQARIDERAFFDVWRKDSLGCNGFRDNNASALSNDKYNIIGLKYELLINLLGKPKSNIVSSEEVILTYPLNCTDLPVLQQKENPNIVNKVRHNRGAPGNVKFLIIEVRQGKCVSASILQS